MKKILILLLLLPLFSSAQKKIGGTWKFRDSVYAMTMAASDNSERVATTAFVKNFISSSAYTPSNLGGSVNVAAATMLDLNYIVIGDVILIFGKISIDATLALTASELYISLPTISGKALSQISGMGSYRDNTNIEIIEGDANFALHFTPQTATNNTYTISIKATLIDP